MTKKLLVVCLGNICRSPLAEAILTGRFQEAGLDIQLDSAGTGSWHVGKPPDARAVVAGRLKGYDLTNLRARRLVREDFDQFDLVLTVDDETQEAAEALRGADSDTPVRKITEYAVETTASEVPDPYYTGQFNIVIEQLEDCATGLVDQLRKARQ